jgi:hypothetical protein
MPAAATASWPVTCANLGWDWLSAPTESPLVAAVVNKRVSRIHGALLLTERWHASVVKKLAQPRPALHLGGPQLSTRNHDRRPPHSNGFTSALYGRPARPSTINTAASTADDPSAPRDAAQAPKTPLHLHPAHNSVRRKLLHAAHDEPAARIQERERHTECAAVAPQLAEAVERGRGRGRKIGRFPSKVWQRMGHRCREGR